MFRHIAFTSTAQIKHHYVLPKTEVIRTWVGAMHGLGWVRMDWVVLDRILEHAPVRVMG